MCMREITLSNGKIVSFDENHPQLLMNIILQEIINPFYEKNNDWNQTIKKGLEEIDNIIKNITQPRDYFVNLLFTTIEKNLHTSIDKLTGVDKIEILFLNIDDYINDILDAVKDNVENARSQESMRNEINGIIRNLNIFEMGEITIYLAKKLLKIKENGKN